jgi:hypothetical protein
VVAELETRVHHPTHDDIARRAYGIFEQRGQVHGHDLDDWLQVEGELRHE